MHIQRHYILCRDSLRGGVLMCSGKGAAARKGTAMRTTIRILLLILTFLGFSVAVTEYRRDRVADIAIQFGGIQPAEASSGQWDGVRALAKFVRDTIRGIDTILGALNSSGLLAGGSTVSGTSGTYRWKYTASGAALSFPTNNEVLGSAPSYSKSFEMCVGSTRVLQMGFDNATSPSTGNGLIVVWQPNKFDSTLVQNTAKIQCSLGVSTNRTMVCTWTGGPFESNPGIVEMGRVRVVDDTSNAEVSFIALARTAASTNFCAPAGGNDFYALTFRQKTASPNNARGRYGAIDTGTSTTSTTSAQLCGTTNANNDGLFTVSGSGAAFVTDGSGADVAGYPTMASLDAVNAQFNAGLFTNASVAGSSVNFQSSSTTCSF